MPQNTLPFQDGSNSKLNFAVFPTVRREDKFGDVGTINDVEDRSEDEVIGQAQIVAKETVCLNDDRFTDEFFAFDTDTRNFDEAFDSLCDCYDSAIEPDEELILYWNRWVDHE